MTPEEFRLLPESRRAAFFAKLPRAHRAAYRDTSLLSPQLDPHRGWQVEVVDHDGNTRRFIVERSQGWRPCNIELKKVSSRKGPPGGPPGLQECHSPPEGATLCRYPGQRLLRRLTLSFLLARHKPALRLALSFAVLVFHSVANSAPSLRSNFVATTHKRASWRTVCRVRRRSRFSMHYPPPSRRAAELGQSPRKGPPPRA